MRIHFATLAIALLPLVSAAPALANPPPPAEAAKPEGDPSAKRITGSADYIPTFGLRASIARNSQIRGVLAVDAGLDVPDPAARKRAEALKPRLLSAMREAVLNYASLSYVVGDRPDADILRIRMQKSVNQILGADQAQVMLASVIVFPQ
jgi:hypothetical protein